MNGAGRVAGRRRRAFTPGGWEGSLQEVVVRKVQGCGMRRRPPGNYWSATNFRCALAVHFRLTCCCRPRVSSREKPCRDGVGSGSGTDGGWEIASDAHAPSPSHGLCVGGFAPASFVLPNPGWVVLGNKFVRRATPPPAASPPSLVLASRELLPRFSVWVFSMLPSNFRRN